MLDGFQQTVSRLWTMFKNFSHQPKDVVFSNANYRNRKADYGAAFVFCDSRSLEIVFSILEQIAIGVYCFSTSSLLTTIKQQKCHESISQHKHANKRSLLIFITLLLTKTMCGKQSLQISRKDKNNSSLYSSPKLLQLHFLITFISKLFFILLNELILW